MAQDPSFDIVSKVDKSELANAVEQAIKEIKSRFDFKGSKSDIKLEENDIVLVSDNDVKIKQVIDVLIAKIAKRGIGLKAFDFDSKVESASGQTVKMKVKIQTGLEKEHTKQITKLIKEAKLKVQPTIMGDYIRVTGKKKDDLQDVQKLINDANLPFDCQYTNYKS
ncbi:MAG: YajQ family cyclic di-GMP-binding protein [Leptospiraceae bacterium]|nr:YajQ family cyclic di-GMP-binding protein [Leptospiraceae bacterium]MCP5496174.1 YajQ family cyclic di-GMP-binding protein [Leptospiraceae bacterium]